MQYKDRNSRIHWFHRARGLHSEQKPISLFLCSSILYLIMLCPACEAIFQPGGYQIRESKDAYIPYFKHHANGQAFRQAALTGCSLCARVWAGLSEQRQAALSVEASDLDTESGNDAIIGLIEPFAPLGCYIFKFSWRNVKWHFSTTPYEGCLGICAVFPYVRCLWPYFLR